MHALSIPEITSRTTGIFNLPGSKSIYNRLAIMQQLSHGKLSFAGGGEAEDSRLLNQALSSPDETKYLGNAGTAMRFLTAFFASQSGTVELHGNSRMYQRPIGSLVNALRTLGAQINYLKKDGFPPLRITGTTLQHAQIALETSTSSQFISALALVAPYISGGISIKLTGKLVSESYLDMTLSLMEKAGVKALRGADFIQIPEGFYQGDFRVEADWSSASFAYLWMIASNLKKLELPGLRFSGLQGDELAAKWFVILGIQSKQTETGIVLSTSPFKKTGQIEINMSSTPDLVPAFLAGCFLRIQRVKISGIHHLIYKETNRLAPLKIEFEKLGASIDLTADSIALNSFGPIDDEGEIETYGDHRMAMAFAPLIAGRPGWKLKEPEVVEKSFPNYWNALKSLGVKIDVL